MLLYGCESWIINDQLMNKVNSLATSCYRVLLGVGRLDKTPNNEILSRTEFSHCTSRSRETLGVANLHQRT